MPILVKALQQDASGHRRNSHWQLAKKHYAGDMECIGTDCDKCKERNNCPHNAFRVMNKAAHFLRKENRWRLFNDIPERALEDALSKARFKEWFDGENGKAMLGELLGPVDLIVIDEAHKNRGESSKLEVNLSQIIHRRTGAKNIAMTATPMELNPEQWKDLFNRIGEKEAFENKIENVIDEFDVAHREANKYPDLREKIIALTDKSSRFKETLKPFVTRRIRIKQSEMLELLNIKPEDGARHAHPHRDLTNPIKIEFPGIEEKWKPSILALEAIGKAAKGCPTDSQELSNLLGRLKTSDSRYAAGQSCETLADENSDDYDKLDQMIESYLARKKADNDLPDEHIQGKLRRIQYWRKILKRGERDLVSHPRIQRVANSIEEAIWDRNGVLNQEKILVFGTYKKPLHTLNHVLNYRAILRFLDRKSMAATLAEEPPIPAAETCLKDLDRIWLEYNRIRANERICLQRTYNSEEQLRQSIIYGGKAYESLRKRLTEHIHEGFAKALPGAASIQNPDKVSQLLRDRLVNELICRGETTSHLKPAELKNRALCIWGEYLESYFAKDPAEGNENQMHRLDQITDNLNQEDLAEMVSRETDHISGHLGFFARTLDGDVKPETRHVLQAQFNFKYSFPQVLIAQSQVGREGLNLHNACRTVIQFHSEWNPGVIEQQIGRVDRIGSFWEEKVREHRKSNPEDSVGSKDFPKINIRQVVFEGTYDHFQFNVSQSRRETFSAHLFGELLSEEALAKMPCTEDWQKLRKQLLDSVPDFAPPKVKMND